MMYIPDMTFDVDLGIVVTDRMTVDSELSLTSENPLRNKAICLALEKKQDKGDYADLQKLLAVENELFSFADMQKKKNTLTEKRLVNLEKGIPSDRFFTDSSVAYEKAVPQNVLPYAQINKIGGMTFCGKNLFDHSVLLRFSSESAMGEDGSVTIKNTDGYDLNYAVVLTGELYAGIYTISNIQGLPLSVTVGEGPAAEIPVGRSAQISYNGSEYICISFGPHLAGSTATVKVMLSKGSTKTEYEPYSRSLKSTPVKEIVSTGSNIFGGDVLCRRFEEIVGGIKNEEEGTVTFSAYSASDKLIFSGFKENTVYTIILRGWNDYGTGSNLYVSYTDGTLDYISFPTAKTTSTAVFQSREGKSIRAFCGVMYASYTHLYYDRCGIFEGKISEDEFTPYSEEIFTLPDSAAELPGYGDGVSEEYSNFIDLDNKQYTEGVKRIVLDGRTYGSRMDGTDPQADGSESVYAYMTANTIKIKNASRCVVEGGIFFGDVTDPQNYPVVVNTNGVLSVSVKRSLLGLGASATQSDILTAINEFLAQKYDGGSPISMCVALAEPSSLDISHLISEDNFIRVEKNGKITAKNKYTAPVSFSITYMQKEV